MLLEKMRAVIAKHRHKNKSEKKVIRRSYPLVQVPYQRMFKRHQRHDLKQN